MLGKRDGVVSGVANFQDDWVTPGWSPYNQLPGNLDTVVAEISGLETSFGGSNPGFSGSPSNPASLSPDAAVVGLGGALPPELPPVQFQYVAHQSGESRPIEAPATLGAMGAP
jgi:hypothetical protein